MKQINLQVSDCSECPFMGVARLYLPNELDHMFTYCRKRGHSSGLDRMKEIGNAVLDLNGIPEWCPLSDNEGDRK